MRMRILELLVAVAFLLAAGPARAIDAPHDQTFSTGQCENCHSMFTTTASGKKDSSYGCVTCHASLANPSLPIRWQSSGHQAVPGKTGNQHSWSGYAQNPTLGATPPPIGKLANLLIDGKLQCAVCHDIHTSSPSYTPNSKHTSFDPDVAVTAGGGWLTLTASANASRAWRVKVQADSTFIISHDFGLATPSWFNWNGSGWVAGTDPGPGKSYLPLGSVKTLDDNVTSIKITGAPAAGTYWDFYVSYPFVRQTNVSDSFCYMCHSSRVMNHVRVSGADKTYLPDGSRMFSHPVSVPLNANAKNYDRAQADVLDPDGSKQSVSGGDGRSENDLRFDGTLVRCTTCHAAHNAASNSLVNHSN